MSSNQSLSPYLIYLDTSVIVDLAYEKPGEEWRHKKAISFIRFVIKYSNSLHLHTSTWAATEAQGVVYGHLLAQAGIIASFNPSRGDRNILPPRQQELDQADQFITDVLLRLQRIPNFRIDQPVSDSRIWPLIRRIGSQAAIYPADSVHLAFALLSSCSLLIAEDKDFLDKVETCLSTFIQPYRQAEFSYTNNLEPFSACGIYTNNSNLSHYQTSRGKRKKAKEILAQYGFI